MINIRICKVYHNKKNSINLGMTHALMNVENVIRKKPKVFKARMNRKSLQRRLHPMDEIVINSELIQFLKKSYLKN